MFILETLLVNFKLEFKLGDPLSQSCREEPLRAPIGEFRECSFQSFPLDPKSPQFPIGPHWSPIDPIDLLEVVELRL